ncbi:histidine phosphatase family protein [bacterium]|nr:MAG: histidine phosphatase family protein [bacterium]
MSEINDARGGFPSELIIIRHGLSELNVRLAIAKAHHDSSRVLLDQIRDADVPLTKIGFEQASRTGQALASHYRKIDKAYVSPTLRTRDTFSQIQSAINYHIPFQIEDRIREREFGIFGQMTSYGIEKHYPVEAARLKLEGNYYYRPLGGESYPDMGNRLHSFLHSIYRHQAGKRILVITHADVVQMIRKILEKLTEAQLLELNETDDVLNCSITQYAYSADINYLRLVRYNEVYYQ